MILEGFHFPRLMSFGRISYLARRRVRLCGAQAQGRSTTVRGRTERFFSRKILLVWEGIRIEVLIL